MIDVGLSSAPQLCATPAASSVVRSFWMSVSRARAKKLFQRPPGRGGELKSNCRMRSFWSRRRLVPKRHAASPTFWSD
jgi:hypothetical protein